MFKAEKVSLPRASGGATIMTGGFCGAYCGGGCGVICGAGCDCVN